MNFQMAFSNPILSLHIFDMAVGMITTVVIKAMVYLKGKMQRNSGRERNTVLPDGETRKTSHLLLIQCLKIISF